MCVSLRNKWCTHARWCKTSRQGYLLPLLCGPFLMLTCPFWGLLALDRVKHGHPDSAGRQPQIGPHKPVFRYIMAAHDPVAGSPLFLPWESDHCSLERPHKSYSFRDVLIQTSSHPGSCKTCSNPSVCPFILLLTHKSWGQNAVVAAFRSNKAP